MENLKIRVNSEAESKEVQELFFKLGYKWFSGGNQVQHLKQSCSSSFGYLVAWCSGCFTDVIQCGCGNEDAKEITLPELRDLVVLKRNDESDASRVNESTTEYYRVINGIWYVLLGEWEPSTRSESWIMNNTKPIEKPMKEYLIKSGDGKYLLTHHDSIGAIEIPEGATKLVSHNYVHLPIMFVKPCVNGYSYCYPKENWSDNILSNIKGRDILWSRHTHPEELPFIDDEPIKRMKAQDEAVSIPKSELDKFGISVSLNDQYAEIEKVRQSHRTASEIADSALKHIRERAETYDQPTGERSAAKTAKAFNAITGKDITESEVWLLLQLLKDVRQWSCEDYHQDSAEDCIAYAALKAESLEGGE